MTNFDELATDLAKAEEELAAAQREIARLRDATGANITDLRAVAALLEERFVSGNSVDITHVRLSKAEWARLAGAVEGTALALAAAQLRIEELEVQFKEMNDHRIELISETMDLRARIAQPQRTGVLEGNDVWVWVTKTKPRTAAERNALPLYDPVRPTRFTYWPLEDGDVVAWESEDGSTWRAARYSDGDHEWFRYKTDETGSR